MTVTKYQLPEPVVIDTHLPTNHKTRGYTAEQMQQAFAAGAASRDAEIGEAMRRLESNTEAMNSASEMVRKLGAELAAAKELNKKLQALVDGNIKLNERLQAQIAAMKGATK